MLLEAGTPGAGGAKKPAAGKQLKNWTETDRNAIYLSVSHEKYFSVPMTSTVISRFTVPRFTVSPDLPCINLFPQIPCL